MESRLFRLAALFILSVALISACQNTPRSASSSPQSTPPLKIAYSAWPGFLPIAIAQEKGFFAQQGVKVAALYSEDTMVQMADLGAEKLDGAALSLGSIVSVASKNPDMQIVLVADQSAGADAIVAQDQIKQVADLKGKRIGTGLGGFGELFVTTMLQRSGLTTDDVTLVQMDGEKVPERLQQREIQAGQTWEPYVSRATTAGARILFSSKQVPGLIPDVIAFRGQVLRDRPDEIRAFVRAWFQAVDFWLANPDEGNALIVKALKLDPKAVSLQGIQLLNLSDNLKAVTPGDTPTSLYYTAKLYSDFFIRTGSLSRATDINQLLTTTFLQPSS